eukprot:gene2508-biopygen2732
MRSRAPGVYNSYEQAHAQIHQFPGGKLSGHSAETQAHRALILWRSAYARFPAPDPARPLHRIYNDVSASGRQSAPPRRAGWGLTVLSSNQPEPHYDQYGPVITFSSEPDFHGASAPTTNTGEVSAVIWALRWIEAHPLAPTQAFEIFSDSFYAMDHTADLLPTQDWGLLPNGDLLHRASNELDSLLTRGIHLASRKVKAHSSLRDRSATLNDRADRLAKGVYVLAGPRYRSSPSRWGPEVLLRAAAGSPILSPSHRPLFIQSTAISPHSTLLAGSGFIKVSTLNT